MPAPKPWTISAATPADAAALVALNQRNFLRDDRFDRRLWRRILGEQAACGQMLTLIARQQDDVRRDNLRARRFYEQLGFRPVREIPNGYADGTDAIRYQVSLDALRRALGQPV